MSLKKKLAALCALIGVAFCLLAVSCVIKPPQGVMILEYHMVNNTESTEYNVPPEEFTKQMKYLHDNGYTAISLLDYAKARKGKIELPEKPVIITFDDGYIDNYTTALPIMQEYGMKATMFMVVNDIGRKGYFATEDMEAWCRAGMELGSHTANHVELPKLDSAKKNEELQASKLLLEWKKLPTVFFLAYPYGKYDQETEELLKKNDYLGALTGKSGLNTMDNNMYELDRINIPNPKFGIWEFKYRILKGQMLARLGR